MTFPQNRLAQLVASFRQWLAENYSHADIAALATDDAGYPAWAEVEAHVGELLATNQISRLNSAAQADLLYLIARNWDVGTLVAWLSPEPNLSNCGTLREADVILLAATATQLTHPEYDDAKYQLAASFRKFSMLTSEMQEILLALFHQPGPEYTQTQALQSLAKLGYPGTRQLLPLAWATPASEHHKMAILAVIHQYLPDPALLAHYLALADALPGHYLAAYVRELRHRP